MDKGEEGCPGPTRGVMILASTILTAQVVSAIEAWPCTARCACSQTTSRLYTLTVTINLLWVWKAVLCTYCQHCVKTMVALRHQAWPTWRASRALHSLGDGVGRSNVRAECKNSTCMQLWIYLQTLEPTNLHLHTISCLSQSQHGTMHCLYAWHASEISVDIRDVTKFEFEFDDVWTSNVFTRFEIWRIF